MLDEERLSQGWAEMEAGTRAELLAWRREHRQATFAELEAVTQAATARQHARYLTDLALASPATDLAATPAAERPRCSACNGALAPSGQRPRRLLTPGVATPLTLQRSYATCQDCGRGVFPPG